MVNTTVSSTTSTRQTMATSKGKTQRLSGAQKNQITPTVINKKSMIPIKGKKRLTSQYSDAMRKIPYAGAASWRS